jgi:RNA polymerase sigma-70 factor (ECF subfamily)
VQWYQCSRRTDLSGKVEEPARGLKETPRKSIDTRKSTMNPDPQPVAPPPRPPADEPSLLATRASLLGRLKDCDNQPSWQEFFDSYWRLVFSAARKAGLTREEAEDAVQDTFVAVARNIGSFRYDPARCSFKSWLLLITRQRIIWQLRKRPPSALHPARTDDDTARTATIDRIPDPKDDPLVRIWDEEWQTHLLAAALERVKRLVSPRQFQIFDLHVLQSWPASEVTRTLHVNVGQVYLAKHRVSALLKKTVNTLEHGHP